jgi:hypothetical protein
MGAVANHRVGPRGLNSYLKNQATPTPARQRPATFRRGFLAEVPLPYLTIGRDADRICGFIMPQTRASFGRKSASMLGAATYERAEVNGSVPGEMAAFRPARV